MTLQEHLLVILMEELGEMQKEISKGLRFGLYTVHEETSPLRVRERINIEWNDINTILMMLSEETNLTLHATYNTMISDKRKKLHEMIAESRAKGLIT